MSKRIFITDVKFDQRSQELDLIVYWSRGLKNKNINFIDTKANFVHVEIIKNRSKFFKALKMSQILINNNKIIKGLDNYVRISIGSKSQMKKVMDILNQL